MIRPLLLALTLAGLALHVQPCLADEAPLSDAKELARADELYKQGNEAFDAKDYEKARGLYLQAFAIKKTYDIAGHLGQAEMELGLYRDAAEHLAAAIRGAPPHQGRKPFEGVIAALEEAKKQVGTITIAAPDGAKVYVDGVEVGTAPLAHELFVETGNRTFSAESAKGKDSETVAVTKGSTHPITLEIAGVTGVAPKLITNPDEGDAVWPGWLLGGAGLVTAGVGAALLGVGQSSLSDATAIGDMINAGTGSCDPAEGPGSERCDELIGLVDDANVLTATGAVLVGVGGAALIGGIVYLLLANDGDNEDEKATPSVAVIPWVDGAAAGLSMQGAF